MNITYDRIADAVYMRVADGAVANTIKLDDRTYIDKDTAGNTIGFEILDASSQPELISGLEENVESGVAIDIVHRTPVTSAQ